MEQDKKEGKESFKEISSQNGNTKEVLNLSKTTDSILNRQKRMLHEIESSETEKQCDTDTSSKGAGEKVLKHVNNGFKSSINALFERTAEKDLMNDDERCDINQSSDDQAINNLDDKFNAI